MNVDMKSRCEELAVFADLGTAPPRWMSHGGRQVIGMCREGEDLDLEFQEGGSGRVVERYPDGRPPRTHRSYRALLASEKFGDLGRWANQQKKFFREHPKNVEVRIPVKGLLSKVDDPADDPSMDIARLDDFLSLRERHELRSVHVMLIDGPAGIGKTKFIESLAHSRADRFMTGRRPLLLHVQSRGRVLTFLQDLIAFSLQTLRLAVTFDQVPVLVRHGLVTLAIDGFDELGDPNGYDLAWSQVNDLVEQVRGEGTLILAGRETFIGHERIERNITTLKECDFVNTLSLQPPEPRVAKRWIEEKGWSASDIESVGELFEPGSYALRPFFLVQIANSDIVSTIRERPTGRPLAFLAEWMIEREAGKFGNPVEEVMDDEKRRDFLRNLLQEVARHLADDQTEAIDEILIAWLVDFVLPEDTDREVLGILKNRASVVAFLEKDDRPNYRRFAHSQIFNHFLGEVVIKAILNEELPKFIRRNILGADFLSAFSDLALHVAESDPERIRTFFSIVSDRVRTYSTIDRGSRNLGALLMTMLPAMEDTGDLGVEKLVVDESLVQGTAPAAKIMECIVNQLDVRGADLRNLIFQKCRIGTLIVDETTRVPESCPIPRLIRDEQLGTGRGRVVGEPREIEEWLDRHGRSSTVMREARSGLVPDDLRHDDLVKLLGRACRNGSYWIPKKADSHINAFVEDPLWPEVFDILKEHDLIREERKGLSRPSTTRRSRGRVRDFFLIRRSRDILKEDETDPQIRDFYSSLIGKIRS